MKKAEVWLLIAAAGGVVIYLGWGKWQTYLNQLKNPNTTMGGNDFSVPADQQAWD